MALKNPVLRGFHPDPSVCRVGEDYYLVNSTFEFFPGVPIFHSKNLVNWDLIGHCLTRPSQLPLKESPTSRGIYAPTLRWHDGTFFMITTNKTFGGNFLVHAKDPRGPWSEPVWIAPDGIDPSLLWDDDGRCYYCSTGRYPDGTRMTPCYEIDPFTGKRLSEIHDLGTGCGGQCPEGPHLYKIGGWYYLLFAEGGTGYGHRVTISRSKKIFGPYESCPHNPILTHMERKGDEIQATGHADLFEDQHGRWWLVCLGVRNFGRILQLTLGRETFLTPVTWTEDGWPVVGEGGYLTDEIDESRLPAPAQAQDFDFALDMQADFLPMRLIHLRNPDMADYVLKDGALVLNGKLPLDDPNRSSPTMLCLRQAAFGARAQAVLRTADFAASRAGISVFQNDCYHNDIYLSQNPDGTLSVGHARAVHDLKLECVRIPAPKAETITLFVLADREKYTFGYVSDGCDVPLGTVTLPNLAQESMGVANFTGVTLAIYAENGPAAFLDYRVHFENDS